VKGYSHRVARPCYTAMAQRLRDRRGCVTSTVTVDRRTRIAAVAVFGRMPPHPADLDRFERDGYVIIPAALPTAEVRRLRALTERVRRSESAGSDGAVHALGFIGREPGFANLVDHPRVLDLVCAALGWNVHVYHCHLDVHPPVRADGAPPWRWHQDGGRQNLEIESNPRPRLSVKVAWFLSDVSRAGHGNLQVIPGSHRRNRLPRPDDPARGVPPPDGAIEVMAAAGTAVVFDRRLWHARSDNHSRTTRRASSWPTPTGGSVAGTGIRGPPRGSLPSPPSSASSSAPPQRPTAIGSPPTRTCRSGRG
jgi:ectoine hydroxylase